VTALVIDSSVCLAWCFEDERSDYAEAVLEMVAESSVIVPSIWPIEVANVVWMGERRKRITPDASHRFFDLLGELRIAIDDKTAENAFAITLELSRVHGITVYDASYLELAIREQATLASLDKKLISAAAKHGISGG
jgi:predicted nucleic acid-binding protein